MNIAFQHYCIRCEHRQQQCAGPCACQLDGRDIIDHAAEGYCPAGKFRQGPGDWLARRFVQLKIAPKKKCGCKKRQLWLNRAWQRFVEIVNKANGKQP